jgi:PAS domain-containing protein
MVAAMTPDDDAIVISEGAAAGHTVRFATAACARLIGRASKDVVGRPLPEVLASTGRERPGFETALAQAHPVFLPVSMGPGDPREVTAFPAPPGAKPPAVWVARVRPAGAGAPDLDFVDRLPLSLVLYDRGDRLAWFNRTYREVLGANAYLLEPGKPFAEIMAAAYRAGHAAGGGDIEARIAERLARHRAHATFEEALAGGRWLLTREIGLKGGGILGVRTDITARKRPH